MPLPQHMAGKLNKGRETDVQSFVLDTGPNGNVPLGRAVERSANDRNEAQLADGNQQFLGVAFDSLEADIDQDPPEYDGEYPMAVFRPSSEGEIIVDCAEAVQVDDDVAYDQNGRFLPGSSGNAVNTLDDAEFTVEAGADEYGAVRLRTSE